jgi:anti-anti-sigma regulatory factor
MLRITVNQEPKAATLRLEGRVVGPWVDELDRAWRSLAASLGSKKLFVDLCGVTYMDTAGQRILADIHKGSSAKFLADSPMTKYFAAEAQRSKTKDIEEGD